MVELDWLMMNYEVSRNDTKPLTILYDKLGSVEDQDGCDLTEKYPNLNLHQVKPKYPYGTHHSKVMVRKQFSVFMRILVYYLVTFKIDKEGWRFLRILPSY